MARCLAWLMAFAAASALAGPSPLPPPPEYAQIGTLSPEKARQELDSIRAAGLLRPAYFEFVLRSLPRRGEERDYPGRLWAARDEAGPVWRIDLPASARRLLVQNGPDAAMWSSDGRTISRMGLAQPLLPGLQVTAFDLLMPYLYWPDARAIGVQRVLGRPADVFVFRPPADFASQVPGLAQVRAYFDAEFRAPVKAEWLDASGRPIRTLSLVDLQRADGQILPKDIDVEDDATHDRTRFSLTAAALGVELSPELFTTAALLEAVRPPPADQIERF